MNQPLPMRRGWVRQLREGGALLRSMPVHDIVQAIGRVGGRFLKDDDPLRTQALARIPSESGLSLEMAIHVLDRMAVDWLEPPLQRLLDQEFNDPTVLDGWVESPAGSGRRIRAMGDGVAMHIGAGSVPGVCATSMIRSLLVKTPVLVKPGAGDRALAELFLKGLHEEDARLGAAAQVAYWGGGDRDIEDGLIAEMDRIVVYGSDATVASVRERTPVHVPFLAYHHRSSVAVLGPEVTRGRDLRDAAEELAWSVATFDQRGCVSPHRVWVIGSRADARAVAEAAAEALEMVEDRIPSGPRSDAEMARVHRVRDELELRAAAGEPVGVWRSEGTRWTVLLESSPELEPAGTPRTIKVAACPSLDRLHQVMAADPDHLQTVGIAGLDAESELEVASTLTRIGATRIVPIRDVSFPPAWWHHDGQGPLRALVRWAEWEEDARD